MDGNNSKICRVGWQCLGTQRRAYAAEFLLVQETSVYHLLQNSFLFRTHQFFLLLKPPADWKEFTHFVGRSALFKVHQFKRKSHLEIPLRKHPKQCLAKYFGIITQPTWHIKLTHYLLVYYFVLRMCAPTPPSLTVNIICPRAGTLCHTLLTVSTAPRSRDERVTMCF